MGCTASATLTVAQETLEDLEPAWQDLLARAGINSPFLSPTWLRVWLSSERPNADLTLLAVRDGDGLIGLAPLLRRGEDLQLAGNSEICDYMDIVALPGAHQTVLHAVLSCLFDSWQQLSLWGLRADSPTLAALPAVCDALGLTWQLEPEAVCPRVSLPPSWDDYLLRLSKKDRHELRRKIRRMAESGDVVRQYALSSPDEVGAAMPDFLRLHRESRLDKAEFMTPAMERFFTEMSIALAGESRIRLYFLEIDERRVAGLLTFDCGDELWLYNSGFDPSFASASVGLVSKALVLRQAIEDGKTCYDFLRGAEPYKYDLGAQDFQVMRATVSGPGDTRAAGGVDGC